MAAKRDYYEVLGVERDVSEAELKSAFRRIAREVHPDVNSDDPEAEAKFKQAAEAYEVLSDPERRRTYDALGHEGLRYRLEQLLRLQTRQLVLMEFEDPLLPVAELHMLER